MRLTKEKLVAMGACRRGVAMFSEWLRKKGWKSASLTPNNIKDFIEFGGHLAREDLIWLFAESGEVFPKEVALSDPIIAERIRCLERSHLPGSFAWGFR
jgi:hypothetical protein